MKNALPPNDAAFRGRLLLLSAAVLWSTSGLIVKSGPLELLPLADRGPLLACYRALFAAAFLFPFVRRRSIRWRAMLVPMVLLFAAMNLLFVTALTRTTAAAAIFLQYTSIVWAGLFGWMFLKERFDRGGLLAAACALIGIGWIVAADWSGPNFLGNLMAVGSGFCYAGVILCLRFLRDEDSIWLIALNHFIAGLVLLPWVLSLGVSLQPAQWALAGLLGVFQMGVPYVLFARGVRVLQTQEAALLTLFEPVLNPFWVWLFFAEPVPTSTWIGGAFIVGGLALRYSLFRRRIGRT